MSPTSYCARGTVCDAIPNTSAAVGGITLLPRDTIQDWDNQLSSETMDRAFVSRAISRYFSEAGPERKRLRPQLSQQIRQCLLQRQMIQLILDRVSELKTQESMEAAVDLLSQIGGSVMRMASEAAFSPQLGEENAVFVLAMAAGRLETRFVSDVLQRSQHSVVREAAIELMANYSPVQARAALERIVKTESIPYLRSRAQDLLQSLD